MQKNIEVEQLIKQVMGEKTEAPKDLKPESIESLLKFLVYVVLNKEEGTGEICGLWNSLEAAGYGIGSVYAIRSAISILPKIGLNTCFALCSPYTAKLVNHNYGTVIEKSVGNEGTFYYPKIDLLATIVHLPNSQNLEGARKEEVEIISSLRENPKQEKMEMGRKGEVRVIYDLDI